MTIIPVIGGIYGTGTDENRGLASGIAPDQVRRDHRAEGLLLPVRGIRDAIRNYIVHYEWMSDVKGERVGVITMVYSHHQRGLVDSLTNIQHEFVDIIQSTLHVHLDHENCLEIVTLRGEGQEVRRAAEKMMALKGVKHVKLTTTSLGTEL